MRRQVTLYTAALLSFTAEACTIFQLGRAGFASTVHDVYTLYAALSSNGSFIVDDRWFPYSCGAFGTTEGGWLDFFQGPEVMSWTEKIEETQPDAPCAWYYPDTVAQVATELGMERKGLQAEAVMSLWKLQPVVQAQVDLELARLEAADKPVMAFHVRGGDKLAEDSNQNRKTTWAFNYVESLVKAFPDLQGGTCLVLGDEHAFVADAMRIATQVLGCTPFLRQGYISQAGHRQTTFNLLGRKERCQSSVQLIGDLELLAHADYFVGTFTSGMGHLVDLLRYKVAGKSRETLVDASAGHADLASKIRQYLEEGRAARGEPERALPRLEAAAAEHKKHLANHEALRGQRAKEDVLAWEVYWAEEERRRKEGLVPV